MGKKVKFVESKCDATTGISEVTLRTKYGTFTGRAKTSPEDMADFSSFFGCWIAEQRAYAKFLKAKLNKRLEKLAVVENMEDEIFKLRDFDPSSYNVAVAFLDKQCCILDKEIHDLGDKINAIEFDIGFAIANRDETVEKLKALKEKKGKKK